MKVTKHVIRAGGKRIRPVLTLLSCQAVGGQPRQAMHAAVAVELLHSFTLIHDDIMDHAPTRRGLPSVHALWGVDSGILAGDLILGLGYDSLQRTGSPVQIRLSTRFTKALLDVCEGQAVDLQFPGRRSVTVREYFAMIEKKTGALFRLSTALGGLIGSGSDRQVEALERYGVHIGRAFQIQDDLLDVVAEERAFGKIVGGDIREKKKTFLLVRAMRKAKGSDRTSLLRAFGGDVRPAKRVRIVTEIYRRLGVLEEARKRIHHETTRARESISGLPRNNGTAMLGWIAGALEARTF
ncbi:MAG: polyprenyl synthetase family protein [Ignavibacteria bacterium]|nr:polyprenyl synthetase family protein [Ignavibacteria bacterium]